MSETAGFRCRLEPYVRETLFDVLWRPFERLKMRNEKDQETAEYAGNYL